MPDYLWDVALSFAGEQRDYVAAVATALKERDVQCFYDEEYQIALWGEDLAEMFDRIYRQDSEFAVLFVSAEYAAKEWTRHERRSAIARAMTERQAYILPARFDDTDLPGLHPTIAYTPLAGLEPADLADMIAAKVNLRREERGMEPVTDRRPGWEWKLFGEELVAGFGELEPLIRRNRMGIVRPSDEQIDTEEELNEALRLWSRQASAISDNLGRALSDDVQLRAFGPPGEAGDPDTIRDMAAALNDICRSFLEWADRLRSTLAPEWAQPVIWAFSRYVEQPIESHAEFVGQWMSTVMPMVERLRMGEVPDEPVEIDIPITFDVPDAIVQEYEAAKASARAQGYDVP